MTGLFVTRQFLTKTFCQKLRNIVSGRLMRHFVTRQFITTKKFTNDNLSPSRQFVTRQFVTMTICHERRLTTTATFSHTTICHNHFYWRQFVTPNNLDVFWLRQFVTIISMGDSLSRPTRFFEDSLSSPRLRSYYTEYDDVTLFTHGSHVLSSPTLNILT